MQEGVDLMRRLCLAFVSALLLLSVSSTTVFAAPPLNETSLVYRARLQPINGLNMSGQFDFVVNGSTLWFREHVAGVEPGKAHGQQIRGFLSGRDAVIPTPDIAGADGLISYDEATSTLGPDRLL